MKLNEPKDLVLILLSSQIWIQTQLKCSIELYDSRELKFYILKGKVFNFIRSPYKVEFKYPIGTKERTLFEEEIETEPNLEFKCTVTAGAQIQKSNTFTITLQESNNIRLSEKLFGPANESYVTREQLTELSDEVNSYFNVVENYQIPQDQFNSAFVENLISLTGQTTFKPVSFDDALNSLSKYSLDFSNDLNANQITKEISEIFKVEKLANKSHIIFDEKYLKELEETSSSSGSGKVSVDVFKIGGGKASAQYAKSQSSYWLDKGSSLSDQLNDLNTFSENKIKYEFEGNKIVPKSLQVSKLQASSFKKTLSFSRIKNFYYEADYNKAFTLTPQRGKEAVNHFLLNIEKEIKLLNDEINVKQNKTLNDFDYKLKLLNDNFKNETDLIKKKQSENMIRVGDIKYSTESSDSNGWLLCNGRLLLRTEYFDLFSVIKENFGKGDGFYTFNIPDLRGRTVISSGNGPSLTNRLLGQIGGEENHLLKINEMPRYHHTIHGQDNNASPLGIRSNEVANVEDPGNIFAYFNRKTSTEGGDLAHNNMQPFIVLNSFIFSGKLSTF